MINNGLPQGLHFKDIKPGDVIEVWWYDAEPKLMLMVVTDNESSHHRRSYKGPVSYRVMSLDCDVSIDGQQVVRHTGRNILQELANS